MLRLRRGLFSGSIARPASVLVIDIVAGPSRQITQAMQQVAYAKTPDWHFHRGMRHRLSLALFREMVMTLNTSRGQVRRRRVVASGLKVGMLDFP